jgi:hypothetical protein
MANNLTFNSGSSFKIKRPLITTNGFVSDVDPTIKSHLDELNALLAKRIFARDMGRDEDQDENEEEIIENAVEDIEEAVEDIEEAIGEGRRTVPRSVSSSTSRTRMVPRIKKLLQRSLTPKRIPGNNWARGSILEKFKNTAETPEKITLSDYIDMTADLSELKYAFESYLSGNWFNLDYNAKAVLDDYPAIRDYLIAYGFYVMELQEVNGLKNFVLSNRVGAKNVANYAIVSAARTIIDQEKLKVPRYNEDDSEIVAVINAAGLSLSSASFKTALQKRIDDYIFNGNESRLIDQADIGVLPPGIKPLLIKYIKHSPVPITDDNVKFFLPLFISQIKGNAAITDPTEVDTEESEKDFEVEFFEVDKSQRQVSRSAIKCAAQQYWGMVVGEEMGVLDVVHYFTTRYMIHENIEIQDKILRDDLYLYTFNDRFIPDLTKPREMVRTRPAERLMFHRQVFNSGFVQIPDDMVVNEDFQRLWKVLILESAKYLERAQASFNPDSYVSRQNVMQAVEDLQYNLSTHCSGMANVITPVIYAELKFVVERIFQHQEIVKHVVPQGGTWEKVVEKLHVQMKTEEMRRTGAKISEKRIVRPKVVTIDNKAKLGFAIIRSIADYNPATFEDDKNFSDFISKVDAFITTQSILQKALIDDLKIGQEDIEQNGARKATSEPMPVSAAPSEKSSHDEWDF